MDMNNLKFIATATFGLEAVVKRELTRLGLKVTGGGDGRVEFAGSLYDMAMANVNLRASDRVQLVMGEFEATTFEELFEQTKALPWEEIIPENGEFAVDGKSIKSTLFSVPNCQRIVKKAVVERMKAKYKTDWFEEDGAAYKIQVALLKDKATLTIDTTGAGLHKRGYRPFSALAPIRETLAAAMIDLSYWKPGRVLFDPMCGSGTIAIEAALIAKGAPVGANREFESQFWDITTDDMWEKARAKTTPYKDEDETIKIFGYDIDPYAIAQAKENAKRAGVLDMIHFDVADIGKLKSTDLPGENGVLITNPPYGQRIGELDDIHRAYSALKRLVPKKSDWSAYIITSDEDFQHHFGRKADAKRKLFNGATKTDYYQYHGPKPVRF